MLSAYMPNIRPDRQRQDMAKSGHAIKVDNLFDHFDGDC
jgi:hypothetical protein